jgi:hypothetical protein
MDDQATKSLRSRNFAALRSNVEGQCDGPLKGATDREKTIYERAASAAVAVQCVEGARASILALTQDAETRLIVNDILRPLSSDAARAKQVADAEVDFMGMKWGLGFGFSFSTSDAIDEAEIVNGIVRATSDNKQQPRAVLEFHKYFWCNDSFRDGTRGCGPFIAVTASPENVLAGVGLGFMYGRRISVDDPGGFSVGVGAILDAKVKDLADGFTENQPPPAGETSVRFREKARWSLLIFATRTF